MPIRQFDEAWGYTRRLAGRLVDRRDDPDHSHEQMVRQRLYGILAGYEDCNDHDTLTGQWPFADLYHAVSRRARLAPASVRGSPPDITPGVP